MDYSDRIREVARQVESRMSQVSGEEATKMSLVAPFIAALGFDVFNPLEVIPEFTADVGIKKGEKVDYALAVNGSPAVLVECKAVGTDLDKLTPSQLVRYFHVSSAKFAVLTDGVHYQFFSDLDDLNKMDQRPFLEFEMTALDDAVIRELSAFQKDRFDFDCIRASAIELKYLRGIIRKLQEEWLNPSDELVKLLTMSVYDGRFTQATRDQFVPLVKQGLHSFIGEHVNRRLNAALRSTQTLEGPTEVGDFESVDPLSTVQDTKPDIETTEDEIEGFMIVKAICRQVVDASRIVMRDTKSYCGVLLDDNNRKPICRLHFNSSRSKSVALFDSEKNERRVAIQTIDDIWSVADELKLVCEAYDGMANKLSGSDESAIPHVDPPTS